MKISNAIRHHSLDCLTQYVAMVIRETNKKMFPIMDIRTLLCRSVSLREMNCSTMSVVREEKNATIQGQGTESRLVVPSIVKGVYRDPFQTASE